MVIYNDNQSLQTVERQAISERDPVINYVATLKSEQSVRVVKSCIRSIAELFGVEYIDQLDWSQLRYEHVLRLRGILTEREYAPQTINLHLSTIRGIAKQAWRIGSLSENEYKLIKEEVKNVSGNREPKGRCLTRKEIKKLFQYCESEGTKLGKRDAAIIALLLGSGTRRSELSWLGEAKNISRIDFEEQSVSVIGKGNNERTVFLFTGTVDAIRDWIEVRGSAPNMPLFPAFDKGDKITNAAITGQTIYDLLRKRSLQAGIKVATPHDFRRTFITWMLEAGADLSVTQDQAGHASPETTKRYDRRGSEAKKNAARKCHIPM